MFKHSRSMGVVMSVLFLVQPAHSSYEWVKSREGVGILGMALCASYVIYNVGKIVGGEDNKTLKKDNDELKAKLDFYSAKGLEINPEQLGFMGYRLDASKYIANTFGTVFKEMHLKCLKGVTQDKKSLEIFKELGLTKEESIRREENSFFKKTTITEETVWVPKISSCNVKIDTLD